MFQFVGSSPGGSGKTVKAGSALVLSAGDMEKEF
jgi:hypothetical protein